MVVYSTEDAWVAFVAGRISRQEFFQVCEANAQASANRLPKEQPPDQGERGRSDNI